MLGSLHSSTSTKSKKQTPVIKKNTSGNHRLKDCVRGRGKSEHENESVAWS